MKWESAIDGSLQSPKGVAVEESAATPLPPAEGEGATEPTAEPAAPEGELAEAAWLAVDAAAIAAAIPAKLIDTPAKQPSMAAVWMSAVRST